MDEAHKGRYQSEFNMGQYYFERFDKILCFLDEMGMRIKMYDKESFVFLQPYFAGLKQLYINLRPLLVDKDRKEYGKAFTDVENELIQMRKKPMNSIRVHKKLDRIHMNLLEVMQSNGMGLQIFVKRSAMSKMKDKYVRGKDAGRPNNSNIE